MTMTLDGPHQKLRAMVEAAGTQKVVAKELHISQQFLCEVLSGKRDVSKRLAAKLGYQRVVAFVERVGDA